MLSKIGYVLENFSNGQRKQTDLVSFGQMQREDRNLLLELTRDSESIIDVRNRQIKEVLQNTAKNGDSKDISLLLNIVKNLKYGYSEASPMANFLNNQSNIAEMAEKQNTNWSNILKNTISSAIEKDDSPEKAKFLEQFNEIYSKIDVKVPNASMNPIYQQQVKAIKLRTKILESPEFNKIPKKISPKDLEDFQINQARTKRNIDYFLASSECPINEKVKILEKLSEMMSPKYLINEQLKDKKVKVLSEILNDIVIRTPENIIPNIKDVDQGQHGMCSAISRARKAVAYEDKLAYINAIYSELDNSPEMKVFDVTNLDKGTKVSVKKTYIDFDSLEKKGYRIIDASTLQWMHIAGTTGNGMQRVENYTAYDAKNYGMFNDSKWYIDLPGESGIEQNYLRALIKTREDLKSMKEDIILQKLQDKEIYKNYDEKVKFISTLSEEAMKTIKSTLPEESSENVRKTALSVLNIEKISNPELRVHPKESEVLKKQKINALVKSSFNKVDEKSLNKLTDELYPIYSSYTEAHGELQKNSSLRKKAAYYNKLFNLGVDMRVCNERCLRIPNCIHAYRTEHKIPNSVILTTDKINLLIKEVKAGRNIQQIAKMVKVKQNKTEIIQTLNGLEKELNVDMANQTDSVLNKLGLSNRNQFLRQMINNIGFSIQENNDPLDADMINYYANELNVTPEKQSVLNALMDVSQELTSNVSQKRMNEIMQVLGIENQLDLAQIAINSRLQYQLAEDEIKILAKQLGVGNTQTEVDEALKKLALKVANLSSRQKQISEIVKAPTAQDIILKNLEDKGVVLSRKTLNELKNKFDEIAQYKLNVEKAINAGVQPPSPGRVFKFTPEELRPLKKIEASVNPISKFIDKDYKHYNNVLESELDKLYSSIGRQKGMFWLGEEGQSGLYSGEHVRIAEQMTGKPYYITENLLSALKTIKKTGKSGVSGTNVNYQRYSGHAQYVADLKTMPVADSKTGKIEEKEVLFHDNSWGPSESQKAQYKGERDSSWKDIAGYERTDYSRGHGGSKGYILDKETQRTGIPVDELLLDSGVNRPDVPDSKSLKKLVRSRNNQYPIFLDLILQGQNSKITGEYVKLVSDIFVIENQNKDLNKFIKIMQDNPKLALNVEKIEKLDDRAEIIEENLMKLVQGDKSISKGIISPESRSKMTIDEELSIFGIDSKETFNRIPENHKLKKVFRKIALYDLPYGANLGDEISSAKTHQELDLVEDSIIKEVKKNIKRMILSLKTPKTKVKTVDDIKGKLPESNFLIDWIGKKFNPATDEELIEKFFELKSMPTEKLKDLVNNSTRAELGIEFSDSYKFIELLRADNYNARDSFNKAVIHDVLGSEFGVYAKEKTALQKAESIYRQLYLTSTYLDKKFLDKYKNEFFKKYQVRPAFPQIPIMQEEEFLQGTRNTVDFFVTSIKSISDMKSVLKMKESFDELISVTYNMTPENQNAMSDSIKTIMKKLEEACPSNYPDVKSLVLNTINSDSKDFASNVAKLKNMMQIMMSSVDSSVFKSNIEYSVKEINKSIEIITKAEIQPRYQARARELMNNLVSSLSKDGNPESPKNIEQIDAFVGMMNRHSVFKNPIDIFHNLLSQIQHPSPESEVNSRVMDNLTSYAKRALIVGNLTNIEYRIMKNINNGNINKFRNLMSEEYLVDKKGEKIKMMSKEGLTSVLYQLFDQFSDNRTLKLFIESMGLNEQSMSVIMSLYKPEKYIERVSNLIKDAKQYHNESVQLQKISKSIVAKSENCETVSEPLNTIINTVTQRVKTETGNSKFVQTFCAEIKKYIKENTIKPFKGEPTELLQGIINKSYMSAADVAENAAAEINETFKGLMDAKGIISAISLNKDSRLFSKSEKYKNDIDMAINKISKNIEHLNKILKHL